MPLPSPVARFKAPAKRDQIYAELARRVELKEDPADISQAMGLALPEVTRLLAQQDFRSYLLQYQRDVYRDVDIRVKGKYSFIQEIDDKLISHAQKALDTVLELMDCDHPMTRLKAAQYWLLMAGVSPIQNNEQSMTPHQVQQFQLIVNEAREIKSGGGDNGIIDTQPQS